MIKVLVVDDSNSIIGMVGFTLKSADQQTIEAKEGLDGLTKAKANDFYLVILDVNMPNIAGITFLINLMRYVLCLSL